MSLEMYNRHYFLSDIYSYYYSSFFLFYVSIKFDIVTVAADAAAHFQDRRFAPENAGSTAQDEHHYFLFRPI